MIKQWEKPWDAKLQMLLTLIVAFNVLPHISAVPIWALTVSIAGIAWKLGYLKRGIPLPKVWLAQVGAVLISIGVFFHYGTILGQEPAAALLVMLASLKLLETNRYRDAMFIILTSYFLLMSHVLESQSLLSTIFMGLDVLLITVLMFHMHKRDRRTSVRSFRPVLRLLALSVPVWLFFFVAFPRFSAALWNVKSQQAQAGFSDNLNPGAISGVVDSNETAFRVIFKGRRLTMSEALYWRGAILTISEGLRWNKGFVLPDESTPSYPDGQPLYHYDVWLEPGGRHWLFALDFPRVFDVDQRFRNLQIRRRPGQIFEATGDIQTRIIYSSSASLAPGTERLSRQQRSIYTQHPFSNETGSPAEESLRAMAKSIESKVGIPPGTSRGEALSNYLLVWFKREGFEYSKQPGLLESESSVDQLAEFLTKRKRGFCEHYASAYANLMRLMGVPARIVVGYQGGAWNEFGNYLLVRQADAHAWAEFWKEDPKAPDKGQWVRADPTAFVAPMRIQLGGDFNNNAPSIFGSLASEELRKRFNSSFGAAFQKTMFAWDSMQMKWNGFLLDFDFNYQLSLLNRLGIREGSRLILTILLFTGLAMFGATLYWALRQRAQSKDALYFAWQSFCMKLENAGIKRDPAEGPLHFAERAAMALPQSREDIMSVATDYLFLRYGPAQDSDSRVRLSRLRQAVQRLSIPTSSARSRPA